MFSILRKAGANLETCAGGRMTPLCGDGRVRGISHSGCYSLLGKGG